MEISRNITKAIELLENDELVAIPTETVYGLAGNIYSESAIDKIFAMKNRPFFNPLIVHLAEGSLLKEIVEEIPYQAQILSDKLWPGPLTLVLPKKETVPNKITAGKSTVAVRVPDHSLTRELLNRLKFPLAAPSANTFGNISPTTPSHVKKYFEGTLKMVLDGGECKRGIESTIVSFENAKPVVLRLGSISLETIESLIGEVALLNKNEKNPSAPGMLARHYAPKTLTFLVDDVKSFIRNRTEKRIGLLLFKTTLDEPSVAYQETLSFKGDFEEASSKLYAALHRLDEQSLDIIVCERLPNKDLGKSINDRLNRATKE